MNESFLFFLKLNIHFELKRFLINEITYMSDTLKTSQYSNSSDSKDFIKDEKV